MIGKELFCLGWHFTVLYAYAAQGKIALFGNPCACSKYFPGECDGDWGDIRQSLLAEAGIVVPIHSNKARAALTAPITPESLNIIQTHCLSVEIDSSEKQSDQLV